MKEELGFLHPLKIKHTNAKTSVIEDEENLRKLKAANYGKWYIKPEDYNKKVQKLNKKL